MRRKIFVIGMAAAAGTALTAMPVSAHQGHVSCKAFGQTVSADAQSQRPWGQTVSHGAQLGLTSTLTAEAHTLEGLCEPRP